MKLWSLKGAAAFAFMIGFVLGAPYLATAGDKPDGQQVETTPAGESQSPASSTDVQERGLPFGTGPQVGSQVLQPAPVPFKCSAATLTCRCYGASDCNWMRRVMGEYCMVSDSCTQNCECRISK